MCAPFCGPFALPKGSKWSVSAVHSLNLAEFRPASIVCFSLESAEQLTGQYVVISAMLADDAAA